VTEAASYLATIPSPTQGVWHLGPFPIRAYALCILVGIVAAGAITEARLRQRGAPKWLVLDIAVWAVPFGIVGGRLYHVITSPEAYFGTNGDPVAVFAVWKGGLGIWGAIALGAVGAWIACRRMGLPLTFFADALAPGLPVAQAMGRLGNWFNNELYGGPTSLPWGLTVYRMDPALGQAETDPAGEPIRLLDGPFHPTFLYELVWNLGVAVLVYLVDRRYKLGKGRAFALYVMAYTVGRFWIEALRIDPAHQFAGMRLNNWVSILVFLGALVYFLRVRGPQEHVTIGPDDRLMLVTAEGEPIRWRAGTNGAGLDGAGSATAGPDQAQPQAQPQARPDERGSDGGGSDDRESGGTAPPGGEPAESTVDEKVGDPASAEKQ
jgi:prolipoprotein diacylglyceryl transferase